MTDFFDPSNPLSPLSPLNPSNPASPLSPLNPSNPASPLYDDGSSNSTTDHYKKSHRKNSGSMNKPSRQARQAGKTLVSWTGIATFLSKIGFSISLVGIASSFILFLLSSFFYFEVDLLEGWAMKISVSSLSGGIFLLLVGGVIFIWSDN